MPKHSLEFEAIGTHWSIVTDALLPESLETAIRTRIETFDKTYSRFRTDSLVSRISRNVGMYTFPEDMDALFGFYEKLYVLTRGKVTPLIGGMLEKAGYDAKYSFIERKQEKLPVWGEVLIRNGSILEVKKSIMIDVGAAGKGYLVDEVCALLDAAKINEYVVDASGDLRHKGKDENRVGLEHPLDPSKVIGVIDVQNKSLCASATNRRKWGSGQHHIFDPDLMKPTEDVIATWVMADSTMVADGLATCLFFTDPNVLRKEFQYEYVRMHADGSIDYSPAFEGKLF
ncbi:MAG TPA: FAD:protein FMN transferase [Candidatus Microsaccharimonas sp.]|jgi:thiamine biosynthesis lipoprotein